MLSAYKEEKEKAIIKTIMSSVMSSIPINLWNENFSGTEKIDMVLIPCKTYSSNSSNWIFLSYLLKDVVVDRMMAVTSAKLSQSWHYAVENR